MEGNGDEETSAQAFSPKSFRCPRSTETSVILGRILLCITKWTILSQAKHGQGSVSLGCSLCAMKKRQMQKKRKTKGTEIYYKTNDGSSMVKQKKLSSL